MSGGGLKHSSLADMTVSHNVESPRTMRDSVRLQQLALACTHIFTSFLLSKFSWKVEDYYLRKIAKSNFTFFLHFECGLLCVLKLFLKYLILFSTVAVRDDFNLIATVKLPTRSSVYLWIYHLSPALQLPNVMNHFIPNPLEAANPF